MNTCSRKIKCSFKECDAFPSFFVHCVDLLFLTFFRKEFKDENFTQFGHIPEYYEEYLGLHSNTVMNVLGNIFRRNHNALPHK